MGGWKKQENLEETYMKRAGAVRWHHYSMHQHATLQSFNSVYTSKCERLVTYIHPALGVHRWIDGWMNGQTDGRMDRWMYFTDPQGGIWEITTFEKKS